jgi:hypothetical protein
MTDMKDINNQVYKSDIEVGQKALFTKIKDVIATYMDMQEDDITIISLWAMAVSSKDSFATIPILYLNASKGSGKTRCLKLLTHIIPNSMMASNLSESALFRLPSSRKLNMLAIDEAERMDSKEKNNLRELLNQCYKEGGCVIRMDKDKYGNFVEREYPIFMGIVLANIFGLDAILEDRAISVILQKSADLNKINMPELFENDTRIFEIKQNLATQDKMADRKMQILQTIFYSYLYPSESERINAMQKAGFDTEDIKLAQREDAFIKKIRSLEIGGRNMELWLPLFITAYFIGDDIVDKTIEIAKSKTKAKQDTEIISDKDTMFAEFLYRYVISEIKSIKPNEISDFISLREIRNRFELEEGQKYWLNEEWIGRFLRRVNCIADMQRKTRGREVSINLNKLKKYLSIRGINTADFDVGSGQ